MSRSFLRLIQGLGLCFILGSFTFPVYAQAPSAPVTPSTSSAATESVTNNAGQDSSFQFRSINPNPAVPIPGVRFTDAVQSEGNITIPFLAQYISGIYRLSVGLGAILAAIMIVYGGFRYLLAASLPDIKDGKTIITDAVIGLVVLLSSYLILKTINPELVALKPITISMIERQSGDSNMADSFARDAGGDASDITTVTGSAPYSGGDFFRGGTSPSGNGRVSQGATICDQRVDQGTANERSGWKRSLRPSNSRDGHVVWCQNCANDGTATCNDTNSGVDQMCLRITGETGPTACGGQFGLYLRGVTGACISKQFNSIEGLDGITFGIRGFWAENMPSLMRLYANEDRATFEEVFRNAGLNEWYQNGAINKNWFCQKQTDLHGLACDANFREALRASGQRPTLIKAQLREAWSRFTNAYNRAAHYFNSDYGRIMWTILANNPGNHERCDLPVLYEACRTSGDEAAIITCILGDGTSRNIGRFAMNRCRGGQASAMARAATIISRLEGVSKTSATPSQDTLDTIVTRCLGTPTPTR
ncbi:hypothetical protein KBD34_05260 [Patescibacteria group bacterium]|nr:hypothetical protein [Patescibacteria group bacterium]